MRFHKSILKPYSSICLTWHFQIDHILVAFLFKVYQCQLIITEKRYFFHYISGFDFDICLSNSFLFQNLSFSTIGTQEWTALTNMSKNLEEDRNLYLVDDRRLLANGFKVALYPGKLFSFSYDVYACEYKVY